MNKFKVGDIIYRKAFSGTDASTGALLSFPELSIKVLRFISGNIFEGVYLNSEYYGKCSYIHEYDQDRFVSLELGNSPLYQALE